MLTNLIKNIFGTRNTRILKDYKTVVTEINNLEEKYQNFTEDDFTKETNNLRAQIQVNDDLSKILPNAFALVREASIRTLGLRHYDEQLMGGIALHNGKIAEMKTGEGKTLVSTLPAYLNSLKNKPVFIVTVNDYLAERDAEWMGQIFKFLGLTVGTITSTLSPDQRKEVYNLETTLLIDPQNEEAILMMMKIALEKSNYDKVKELSETFVQVCKKLCDEKNEILESLKNLEPSNES